MLKITPFLWFDNQAEEAAKFYASIFKNSRVLSVSRYGKEGHDIHGMPEGTILTVEFQLNGQRFTALNGGPQFKFNQSISFQVFCDNQKELDHYWKKLSPGGDPKAQACGWLKDKFGLSWQVVPREMKRWVSSKDKRRMERLMKALLPMKKLDIQKLKRAYAGKSN
jgi:predicted 3-demethylubiquinone-9 3-methyltransferase (glyoxalase superfamily)